MTPSHEVMSKSPKKKKTNLILFFIEDVVVGYKVNLFSVNFVCSDCPHYFKSTIIFKIAFENQQITKSFSTIKPALEGSKHQWLQDSVSTHNNPCDVIFWKIVAQYGTKIYFCPWFRVKNTHLTTLISCNYSKTQSLISWWKEKSTTNCSYGKTDVKASQPWW